VEGTVVYVRVERPEDEGNITRLASPYSVEVAMVTFVRWFSYSTDLLDSRLRRGVTSRTVFTEMAAI
jgi:hypothetical protein